MSRILDRRRFLAALGMTASGLKLGNQLPSLFAEGEQSAALVSASAFLKDGAASSPANERDDPEGNGPSCAVQFFAAIPPSP
jgi:hypothetical protein